MPREDTIELRHIRGVVGETSDVPSFRPDASVITRIRNVSLKLTDIPHLIHDYGVFNPDSRLVLGAGENNGAMTYSDAGYLYGVLSTVPGKIVRADLSSFLKINTLTLNAGEDNAVAIVSDGTYLYAGLNNNPAGLVRINRRYFTRVDALVLPAGDSFCVALVVDGSNIYLLTGGAPGKVVKIDAVTMAKTGQVVLPADGNGMWIDDAYIYVSVGLAPPRIVRINRRTFAVDSTLALSGAAGLTSLASDGIFLYASAPTGIYKIDLLDFTEVSYLDLTGIVALIGSSCTDERYLYVSCVFVGNVLLRVDLADFRTVYNIVSEANAVNGLSYDGSSLYYVVNSNPDTLVRKYLIPHRSTFQKRADLVLDQVHSGRHYIYPTGALGVTATSGVGAFNYGVYVQIVPANTILTAFYMTAVFLHNLNTINNLKEVQIATGQPGAEVVVFTGNIETASLHQSYEIPISPPIKVASNTRISARIRDETGGKTVDIKIRYKD